METKGKIVDITKGIFTGKLRVTFEIDTEPVDELNGLAALDKVEVIARKVRNRRSLDANAYFHVLVGKIADVMGISKTYCKNMMICRYGQQDLNDDGSPIVIKANIPVERMNEQEFLHCEACKAAIENGKEVVFYKLFRGSHTYTTQEMAILINGTIEEAKNIGGIEVLSPAEIERMVGKWRAQ